MLKFCVFVYLKSQFSLSLQIAGKNLRQEAISFARSISAKPLEPRINSKMSIRGVENATALRDGKDEKRNNIFEVFSKSGIST